MKLLCWLGLHWFRFVANKFANDDLIYVRCIRCGCDRYERRIGGSNGIMFLSRNVPVTHFEPSQLSGEEIK